MIDAQTFRMIVLVWIGAAIILFPFLLRITAPYGRHSRKDWGPMISNRLGWFIMESPALLVFLYFYLKDGLPENTVSQIAASLWVVHYIHRAVIFPFRVHTKGKRMPVMVMVFAVFFNLVNGFINGYWLGNLMPERSAEWLFGLPFIVGSLLFAGGFIINQYHDKILISLRKKSSNEYRIPYGGLFRWISCPNHFGEIIEWGGFALLTWGLPGLSFLIWTFVNLAPRSLDHHTWYKSRFIDYPLKRKALVPFVL